MAEPITWRSINTPDFRSSTASLDSAARLFSGAFTSLQEQLKQREDTVDQNWKAGKEYNTNLFLDRLAQFQTPEEAQKALESGDLTNLRSQFGAQVDGAAIRAAQTNLVKGLQDRALSNLAYTDKTTEIKERPIVGQASRLINEGKFAEARDLVNNSGLREETKAALLGNAKIGERNDKEWGFKVEDQGMAKEKHASSMLTDKLQQQKLRADLTAPKTPSMGDQTAYANLLAKAFEAATAGANDVLKTNIFNTGSPSDKATDLQKVVKNTGISNWNVGTDTNTFVSKVIKEASKGEGKDAVISADGSKFFVRDSEGNIAQEVPLSAAVLERAIENANGWLFDPSIGGVVKELKELAKNPDILAQARQFAAAKENIATAQQGLQRNIGQVLGTAAAKAGYGSAPPKKPTNQR